MTSLFAKLSAFLFAYAKAHGGGFVAAASTLFVTIATNSGHLTAQGWYFALGAFVSTWLGIAITSNTVKSSDGAIVVVPPTPVAAPDIAPSVSA